MAPPHWFRMPDGAMLPGDAVLEKIKAGTWQLVARDAWGRRAVLDQEGDLLELTPWPWSPERHTNAPN